MRNKETKIMVVGASIAGSYFSYLLGHNGYSCTLLDIDAGLNKKACGEGLSIIGRKYLCKSGLWEGYLAETARPYFSYNINFNNESVTSLKSSKPLGFGIERDIIDKSLKASALSNAFVTSVTDKIVSIKKTETGWVLKSPQKDYEADIIVMACGIAGRLLVGNTHDTYKPLRNRYGLSFKCKGTWNEQAPDSVYINNFDNYQILLNPLNETTINLNVLINKESERKESRSKESFVSEALTYAEKAGFSVSSYEECRGASTINSSVSPSPPPGIFFIGDTAEILDPIGGLGMTHALVSASLAAESLIRYLKFPKDIAQYQASYQRRRRLYAKILRFYTRISYALNVSQHSVLVKMAKVFPSMTQKLNSFLYKFFPIVGAATKVYPLQFSFLKVSNEN